MFGNICQKSINSQQDKNQEYQVKLDFILFFLKEKVKETMKNVEFKTAQFVAMKG